MRFQRRRDSYRKEWKPFNLPPRKATVEEDEVSLKEHIELLCKEREKRIDDAVKNLRDDMEFRFEVLRIEMTRTARELEPRLERMNELRAEVISDRGLFIQRPVYEAEHKSLEGKVTVLEGFRNRSLGLVIVISLFSGLIGAMALAVLHPLITKGGP